MSDFKFSTRSEGNMRGVHPELLLVMREALKISKVDFAITQGVRTKKQQSERVASGASATLNSRHIPENNDCGESCAVDVMAYLGGSPTWDWHQYERIARAVFRAAIALKIQVEWGGFWKSPRDGVHFQLSWKDYP